MELVSKNLRWLRQSKGLKQEQLADIIGVNRGVLSNWETGKNGIKQKDAETICKYFLISIDDFYSRDFGEENQEMAVKEPQSIYQVRNTCKNCEEKEKIIAGQQKIIQAQEDAIATLKKLLAIYENRDVGEKKAG